MWNPKKPFENKIFTRRNSAEFLFKIVFLSHMFRYDGAEWTDHKGPRLPDTIFAGFDPVKFESFWTYQVRVHGCPSFWKLLVSGHWSRTLVLVCGSLAYSSFGSVKRNRWISSLIDRQITKTGHITWFLFSILFLRRSFEVDFISRKGLIWITVRHAVKLSDRVSNKWQSE